MVGTECCDRGGTGRAVRVGPFESRDRYTGERECLERAKTIFAEIGATLDLAEARRALSGNVR
jgi:hypothetical protein